MRTVTNMPNNDLKAEYLRCCDRMTDIISRLKKAVAEGPEGLADVWYSDTAYLWRCLTDIQKERERRRKSDVKNE